MDALSAGEPTHPQPHTLSHTPPATHPRALDALRCLPTLFTESPHPHPHPNPHQTLVEENLARVQREERLVAEGAVRRTSVIEGDVRSSSTPQVAEGQGGEEAEEEESISGRGEEGFGGALGSVELDEEAEKERVDALFFRV